MRRVKFQDLLRRSFRGYICIIILAILILMLGGLALNFATVVVGGSRESNQSLAEHLSAQYAACEDGLQALSGRQEIRNALLERSGASWTAANQQLYQFVNEQEYKAYFVLLDGAGVPVCSNFNGQNQEIFAGAALISGMRERLDKDPAGMLCFICDVPLTSEQMCSYSFCRNVRDENGDRIGYLFFNLRTESLHRRFRTVPQEVLLTDRYDNIVYTTLDLEDDPEDKLPPGKYALGLSSDGIREISGDHYYVSVSTVTPQGLKLYTLTSLAFHIQTLWYGLSLFLLLLAILAAIVALLTRAFARQNARELGELTRAVEELDRSSELYELSPQCSVESQQLYAQFRRITLHLRELIRYNSELQDRRRQMEIKQLEEQFNPHFVFNVMEMVRYQIREDPEAASEMLLSFANLMRYSINYGHTKVSLETDVEYVNDYLLLQKVRYNNCLRYEFIIPDQLLECQVPKLLLQPVIENSIKHGYQQGKILEIVVQVERVGDELCFVVRDNGRGIDGDRLAAIRESFTMELNSDYIKHIGLYNIQKVVELMYGPDYGLTIESTPGEGTTVTLTMPYEVEMEAC